MSTKEIDPLAQYKAAIAEASNYREGSGPILSEVMTLIEQGTFDKMDANTAMNRLRRRPRLPNNGKY